MNTRPSLPSLLRSAAWACLICCTSGALAPAGSAAEPPGAKTAPVPMPALDRFKPLWNKSLLTARTIEPSAPGGPSFADGLALAGIFEIDGRTVAVVMDKTSSQFTEVTAEPGGPHGMQIVKIEEGATPDRTRVQIQRGHESGWIRMGDAPASAPGLSTGERSNGTMAKPGPQLPANPPPGPAPAAVQVPAQPGQRGQPQPDNGDAPHPPL